MTAPFPYTLQNGLAPRALVFDLDETLIAGDSTQDWTEWLYETGTTTDPRYREATRRMVIDYRAGTLDIAQFMRDMSGALEGLDRAGLDTLVARFVAERILPKVYPEGRRLVAAARAAGIHVLVISASAAYFVGPIANALGIHESVGIDLVPRAGGVPGGEILGTPSFREGKVARLRQWVAEKNPTGYFGDEGPIEPKDVFFFTDSFNDLPLALEAGGAALVNPDDRMLAEGRRRGWPVLAWTLA